MRFQIDVPDCCDTYQVLSAEHLVESVSRTVIVCTGCGQRRVLTVTNLAARVRLEVVP